MLASNSTRAEKGKRNKKTKKQTKKTKKNYELQGWVGGKKKQQDTC